MFPNYRGKDVEVSASMASATPGGMVQVPKVPVMGGFNFIECFTTTFLRAHSWLNWVDEDDDEDEVGLKEKPEDTRYIKKITSK